MVTHCVGFCINEFLWMLSWGWYQLAFGLVFSWILYVFFGKMKMLPALILAFGSYGFSVFIYFSFVAGVLVTYFQWQFSASELPRVYSALYASLILGIIYSVLQLFFYSLISYWHKFSAQLFFVFSLIANTLSAVCASYFIKVIF